MPGLAILKLEVLPTGNLARTMLCRNRETFRSPITRCRLQRNRTKGMDALKGRYTQENGNEMHNRSM